MQRCASHGAASPRLASGQCPLPQPVQVRERSIPWIRSRASRPMSAIRTRPMSAIRTRPMSAIRTRPMSAIRTRPMPARDDLPDRVGDRAPRVPRVPRVPPSRRPHHRPILPFLPLLFLSLFVAHDLSPVPFHNRGGRVVVREDYKAEHAGVRMPCSCWPNRDGPGWASPIVSLSPARSSHLARQ